ncbi:MAG TPA: hypothetical protein VHE30_13855 [Polyangiaceae bacterium]|nr:hypothetical protein [Polyangiaceae bacterium]
MFASRPVAALLFSISLTACSGTSAKQQTAPATEGALPGSKELIAHDWTIGPGVETYFCVYQTLTEDVWISAFDPTEPLGTHHVVVGFDDPGTRPDGVVSSEDGSGSSTTCSGVQLSQNMVYFGGVGAGSFEMPKDVAVRIPAGKQLFLGLHLFNTADTELSGRSGMRILGPDGGTAPNEAEAVAMGKVAGLVIPPGKVTQTGTCTETADATAFALAPHMHLAGRHNKTTVGPPGGPATTIFDEDYAFEAQPYTTLPTPVLLHQNDVITVECDYENTGSQTLNFGESTRNEMCFSFVYRYPKIATTSVCTN